MEALTKDEFLRLLAKAHEKDPRAWVMILIHFWHAGRNSEIINLTRDNFTDGYIIFDRGKNSLPCRQRLVEHTNPLLNEKKAVFDFVARLAPNQRLFRMSRWTYWRHLVKLAVDAGIPRIKAKTTVLKHSICTYMYENAAPNAVQRRAGHVNGANTLRYGTLQEEQVDALVVDAVGL